ncbi:hypothetical protein VTO73DRAFT_2666 [Trametes versicolor]
MRVGGREMLGGRTMCQSGWENSGRKNGWRDGESEAGTDDGALGTASSAGVLPRETLGYEYEGLHAWRPTSTRSCLLLPHRTYTWHAEVCRLHVARSARTCIRDANGSTCSSGLVPCIPPLEVRDPQHPTPHTTPQTRLATRTSRDHPRRPAQRPGRRRHGPPGPHAAPGANYDARSALLLKRGHNEHGHGPGYACAVADVVPLRPLPPPSKPFRNTDDGRQYTRSVPFHAHVVGEAHVPSFVCYRHDHLSGAIQERTHCAHSHP